MTVFQPVSIKKAYEILKALPIQGDKKSFIEYISKKFNMSHTRANMYLRALKRWGFIEGTSKELNSKHVGLDTFLRELREIILNEVPTELMELLLEIKAKSIPFSEIMLQYFLRARDIKISLWKLRLIIKYLRFIGIVREIKTIAITNEKRAPDNTSRLIEELIMKNVGVTLDSIIKNLLAEYPIDICHIKRCLLQLAKENKIIVDMPSEILNIWFSENPCTTLVIEKQKNPKAFDIILHLMESDKRFSDIVVAKDRDRIELKQWEGKFIVIPMGFISDI